jgi:hypothetical protein
MKKVDFTQFGPNGPVGSAAAATIKQWWKVPKKDLYQAVNAISKTIVDKDSPRQTQLHISARLYGNVSMLGLNGLSYTKVADVKNSMRDRVSYNVVQSVVDTKVARMAKNKPTPMYLTSGADYKTMRKAKRLDKWTSGVFYENKAYEMGPMALRDSEVKGTGVIHIYEQDERIKWERVLEDELYTDVVDSVYGEPRQLHRIKSVDRDVLIDMFPEHKDKLIEVQSASSELKGVYESVSDLINVHESWHLRSGKKAKDGMHAITIENCTLLAERYDKDFYPFVFIHSNKRLLGFWGQGTAERLQSIQLEINKILWTIQRSMFLHGTYRVWIKTGSKLPKEHVNNEIGAILVSDEKPEYLSSSFIPQEYFAHLQTLKNSAFEQEGVSQLNANAQKPAGLDSGKALRTYDDLGSDRLIVLGQNYEQLYMDCARLSISIAKDIYDRKGHYEVKFPGSRFIESIDWADINLEEDEYVMKIFPISSLPQDPAGRLQTITEYLQAGFLTPRQARRLLTFPDLESEDSLSSAREEYLHQVLDKIVDDGDYTVPEPEDDLVLANELVLTYYAQGKCLNLEEERLEMLRRFRDQVNILQAKAVTPPTGAGPQPGGTQMPQANPQPTPTSPLVPNVNGPVAA